MPLDTFVGKVEAAIDSHPFEGLAAKVLFDILGVGREGDVGGGCPFFFSTALVGPFFVGRLGDDYVVLGVELVESGGVFFIDEELFFEFELELVLPVGFDPLHEGHPESMFIYCSSLPSRWLEMRAMGISPAQLSQEPTNFKPSISRFEVILIVPSLLTGKYIFLG